MSGKMKYLAMEQPDNRVRIDYLGFCPSPGLYVEGVVIDLTLEFLPNKQEAQLRICATDVSSHEVVCDQTFPVTVEPCEGDEK